MAFRLDIKFHCTRHLRRSARRSKHHVLTICDTVKKVLTLNPEHGVIVSGTSPLRKMRVAIPRLNFGKSGGYRLIYRAHTIDEVLHIILLEIYFKGEREDLDVQTYRRLLNESDNIISDPLAYSWEDAPPLP